MYIHGGVVNIHENKRTGSLFKILIHGEMDEWLIQKTIFISVLFSINRNRQWHNDINNMK